MPSSRSAASSSFPSSSSGVLARCRISRADATTHLRVVHATGTHLSVASGLKSAVAGHQVVRSQSAEARRRCPPHAASDETDRPTWLGTATMPEVLAHSRTAARPARGDDRSHVAAAVARSQSLRWDLLTVQPRRRWRISQVCRSGSAHGQVIAWGVGSAPKGAGRVTIELDEQVVHARRGLQVQVAAPAAVAVGPVQRPRAVSIAKLVDLQPAPFGGRNPRAKAPAAR